MKVLALDPGPAVTGWALMDGREVVGGGVMDNEEALQMVVDRRAVVDLLAVEMIASYGMAVGREVFETCVWIGKYHQAWQRPESFRFVYRQEVKLHLCKSAKAKDANVRAAILDLFPRTGGGAVPQVGNAKKPGPLFGFSSHAWPALGVALSTNPEYNDAAARTGHSRLTPRRRARLLVQVRPVPVAGEGSGGGEGQDDPDTGRRDRRKGRARG